MRQPKPRARGWLRKFWNGEVSKDAIPPEYYPTVMALYAEAKRVQARLNRILSGR